MQINVQKTKIVVYRNGGRLANKEVWYLNNNTIEVVPKFRYLGLQFSSSGLWSAAQAELARRASRGMFCIKNFAYNSKIHDVNILLKLFDSCIGPILNYGSEIWGFHQGTDIERVCDNFYKFTTKLPRNCNNIAARGELGRNKAFVKRYIRIIKYWLKLISTSSECSLLLQKAYKLQVKMDSEGKTVWASDIRTLLCCLGFSQEWQTQKVEDNAAFLKNCRERLSYMDRKQFSMDVLNSPRLQFYAHMKLELRLSDYWNCELPFCMKSNFCRLLCSGHSLTIETGRRINIPRHERVCNLCNLGEVEDEVHFILKCPTLQQLRVNYIPPEYWSMPGWNTVLSLIINPVHLESLIKYCFYASKRREKLLSVGNR